MNLFSASSPLASAAHLHHGPRGAQIMCYVYDSYLIPLDDWKQALKDWNGAYLIGLLVDESHMTDLAEAGFDGMYTYFAADGFTWGSTSRNWSQAGEFCRLNRLLWIPSVGPGYDDSRVRPWNGANFRAREEGAYFRQMFERALASPQWAYISITSFNEWHEGTQIEPAEEAVAGFDDYRPLGPTGYLEICLEQSRKAKSASFCQSRGAALPGLGRQ